MIRTVPNRSIAKTIKELQKGEFQLRDRVITVTESEPNEPAEVAKETDR